MTPLDFKLGALREYGEEGLEHRSMIAEFFRLDNLKEMTPEVRRVINTTVNKFTTDSQGKLNIPNPSVLVLEIMTEIVSELLFGRDFNPPKAANGQDFCRELMDILKLISSDRVNASLINFLGRNIPVRWGLLPGAREAQKRIYDLVESLKTQLLVRKKKLEQETKRNHLNLVDMLLDYNNHAPVDKKLSLEEMAGYCNSFLIAGLETSSITAKAMIYFLGKDKELQEQVRSEIKELNLDRADISLEDLDKCPLLDKLVHEALRVYTPSPVLFPREVMKDLKIGNIEFRKGDQINILVGPQMWDQADFGGRTFNMDSI